MRGRVWLVLMLVGAACLLVSPEIEAKKQSAGKRACSMTCFGGGYNKCRVVGEAKPNQCPVSKFYTP